MDCPISTSGWQGKPWLVRLLMVLRAFPLVLLRAQFLSGLFAQCLDGIADSDDIREGLTAAVTAAVVVVFFDCSQASENDLSLFFGHVSTPFVSQPRRYHQKMSPSERKKVASAKRFQQRKQDPVAYRAYLDNKNAKDRERRQRQKMIDPDGYQTSLTARNQRHASIDESRRSVVGSANRTLLTDKRPS